MPLNDRTASALLAAHFSGPGFGKLNGSAVTTFALAGALGSFLMGHLCDGSGSYWSGFTLLSAIPAAGAAAAVALDRLPRRSH